MTYMYWYISLLSADQSLATKTQTHYLTSHSQQQRFSKVNHIIQAKTQHTLVRHSKSCSSTLCLESCASSVCVHQTNMHPKATQL